MAGFTHESQKNETIEWYTPPGIFDALGLEFDLDPCSPGAGKSFVPAKKHYTIKDDGLAQPWNGLAFVNPPYGNQTGTWLKKLADHGNGIGLVFSRTDTQWFHDLAKQLDLVCFVKGRIKFYRGGIEEQPGTPGTGSMLLGFGKTSVDALLKSNLGVCMEVKNPPAW